MHILCPVFLAVNPPGVSLCCGRLGLKKPNPQRQWDIESLSSTEQQQPQAEATTLLHESPDSKPETIEQRKIVFHYIRVWVAWVGIVPLVRAKPTRREQRESQISMIKHWQCSFVQKTTTTNKPRNISNVLNSNKKTSV